MKAPKFILPHSVKLKANSCIYQMGSLMISARTSQVSSKCPLCNKRSGRIHSKYFRALADLPISGSIVKIKFVSRKYFCDNKICSRKIFTERFSEEIVPYSRRMTRSIELTSKMALELGGNKGAGISKFIAVPVSSSTIVRIIKRLPNKEQTITSGIIGIDDWAFKKGRTYGIIVVDLNSNQVVDLLPDREVTTVSDWIKRYPEIQVISRDRYGPYALGASKGAPQAIQVADRFHLMKNLGDATNRMFQPKSKVLKEVYNLYNDIQPLKESAIQTQLNEAILLIGLLRLIL
jgi:transposase